jgi:hypothetical protein
MIEVVRLMTVHPALVHFTIGALPVIVLGYAIAARRQSERWTFAADVALVITALLTVATAAFGLVSNAVVPWPGGLALWRWLHLGFGAASTVFLLGFAAVRLWRRRRVQTSGRQTVLYAVAMALIIVFTGWIGGEVLVFRAGMAVRAAGDGALAPPAVRPKTPKNLEDAMGRLRAAWAASESTTSAMIVQEPSDRDFATIERSAAEMTTLTRWIAREGPAWMSNASQPSEHRGDEDDHAQRPMTVGEHLTLMAHDLEEKTVALERAAHARDLTRTAQLVGDVQAGCADCHLELRWPPPASPQALR